MASLRGCFFPLTLRRTALLFARGCFCFVLLLLPIQAKADVSYPFLSVECDSAHRAVHVAMFFEWNEAGKANSEHLKKNTYYFDDVAKSKKTIACRLDQKHEVIIKANKDAEHPRNDSVVVFLGGRRTSFHLEDMQVNISSSGGDYDYFIEECVDESNCRESSFNCEEAIHSEGKACAKKTFTAASYDCSSVQSGVEHFVCSNDRVAEADAKLSTAFLIAKNKAKDPNLLTKEQRQWLLLRNNKCKEESLNENCLIQLYATRIDELKALASGGSR